MFSVYIVSYILPSRGGLFRALGCRYELSESFGFGMLCGETIEQ